MLEVEVTVIGGGVVGCAVAAEAARRGLSTVLLEKEARLATGVTARNSEVAHGGMYYPTGSLKARFCVRGRRLLREFCSSAGVDYHDVGKLIVATDPAQESQLEQLLELGRQNDVEDLRLIGNRRLSQMEPNVRAVAALYSPRTGILDSEGAARAYGQAAGRHGAQVLTSAPVTGLERSGRAWRVRVGDTGRQGWTHLSRRVVNAAGLFADEVAELAGLDPDAAGLRQHWVKGNYFGIAARHGGLVKRLIYPAPPTDGTSLGIHLCLDLAGQLRLGPDFEPIPRQEDFGVDPDRRGQFYAGARGYLPFLSEDDLTPAMAGIRPKLATDSFADFILREEQGECDGLVNLVGIDSPGLTSAPAIAEAVADLLQQ